MVCTSCCAAAHKVKHESQQGAIIVTLIWLLGTTLGEAPLGFTVKNTKPLQHIHTHLQHNSIQTLVNKHLPECGEYY